MGLIKFRKGREPEVGIEAPREFEFGVDRLERDVDFDIAYRTKEDLQLRLSFTAYCSALSYNRQFC